MESGRLLDSAIVALDRGLRSVFAPARARRPLPGGPERSPDPLPEAERRASAALMRVNHAGELAAQALYHGQAFAARSAATREMLLAAASSESDHLAWCETRLKELAARPSLLNPLWYAGSFAIGAATALLGDRASLGFVAETERQVEGHLDDHLASRHAQPCDTGGYAGGGDRTRRGRRGGWRHPAARTGARAHAVHRPCHDRRRLLGLVTSGEPVWKRTSSP